MKKTFFRKIIFVLVFSCFAGSLFASEDFLLLRRKYYQLHGCYKLAMSGELSPERQQEMEQLAKDFLKSCRIVQPILDEMGIAPDIQFVPLARELLDRSHSYSRNYLGVVKKTDENDVKQGRHLPVKKVMELLENDILILKEYNFSTSHGGTVDPLVSMWPRLYEYKRFIKFYQKEKNFADDLDKNLLWRSYFVKKMNRAVVLAKNLNELAQKECPNWEGRIDVVRETKVLERCVNYQLSSTERVESAYVWLNSMDNGKRTADREKMLAEDQKLALKRLTHFLSRLEQILKDKAEKEQEKQKKIRDEQRKAEKQANKDTATAEKKESAEKTSGKQNKPVPAIPVERWKDSELDQGLKSLHDSVFPAAETESFSQSDVTRCLNTLSSRQQEQYEKIRRRLIRSGVSETDAPLAALKELKPILSGYNIAPTKQEKIDILKKAGK